LCNDKALLEELVNTVEQWTMTIKDTTQKENNRVKETKSAQGETDYWR
jgi:hypothetical protein